MMAESATEHPAPPNRPAERRRPLPAGSPPPESRRGLISGWLWARPSRTLGRGSRRGDPGSCCTTQAAHARQSFISQPSVAHHLRKRGSRAFVREKRPAMTRAASPTKGGGPSASTGWKPVSRSEPSRFNKLPFLPGQTQELWEAEVGDFLRGENFLLIGKNGFIILFT